MIFKRALCHSLKRELESQVLNKFVLSECECYGYVFMLLQFSTNWFNFLQIVSFRTIPIAKIATP